MARWRRDGDEMARLKWGWSETARLVETERDWDEMVRWGGEIAEMAKMEFPTKREFLNPD